MAEPKALKVPEVAERLGYTRQHVYRLIRSGDLRAIQLTDGGHWRVTTDDLAKFLDGARSNQPAV